MELKKVLKLQHQTIKITHSILNFCNINCDDHHIHWVRNKIRKITYLVGDVRSDAEDPEFEDELELLKLKKLNWLKKSSIFSICLLLIGVCLSFGPLILFLRFFTKSPLFSEFDSDIGFNTPLFPEAFSKTSVCRILLPSSVEMVKQYKISRQVIKRKMTYIHIVFFGVLQFI